MVLNQAWMSTGYQCFILIGQIYLISIVSELFQNQYNMGIILMKLSSCIGNGLLKIHEHDMSLQELKMSRTILEKCIN